jgi:hypothetical protein
VGKHAPARRQLRHNRRHLFGGLARAEHHFGEALAQRAVVVNPREAQVLIGQVAQGGQRVLHTQRALCNLLQQQA